MKQSKLMMVLTAGLSTALTHSFGPGKSYTYRSSKSPQSPSTITELQQRALVKAQRKGWNHIHGKFAKV